jgi:membrane-associated HD superfamily phosphohydrolase
MAFVLGTIALVITALALITIVICVRMMRVAILRAEAAEQATADATARADRAIELWNAEQETHHRNLESVRAHFEVLKHTAMTSVQQYRAAFDQLARLVAQHNAPEDDHDATGSPPTRVM